MIVGLLGAMLGTYGVVAFNRFVRLSIVAADINTYGNLCMSFCIVYLQLVLLKNLCLEDLFIKKLNSSVN